MKEKIFERNLHTEAPQPNERDEAAYEHFLGVKIADEKGKRVVNVGSGHSGIFDKDLARSGAKVISVSPYFAATNIGGEQMREAYREGTLHKIKRRVLDREAHWPDAVGALAEQLPIKDASVDSVLALYSVPLYSDKENYDELLTELTRVLKEGGSARLYPVSQEMMEDFTPILETLPVTFSTEPIEERNDTVFPGETPVRLTLTRIQKQ